MGNPLGALRTTLRLSLQSNTLILTVTNIGIGAIQSIFDFKKSSKIVNTSRGHIERGRDVWP